MSPSVALFLGYAFAFWMIRKDMKQRKLTSTALWVPILWLAQVSTKPLGFWLECIGIRTGGTSKLEGNPVELVALLGLIIASLIILNRRNFNWGGFFLGNKILLILYVYLALSASWSEHSFPTLKRVVKDLGAVFAALVILTESDPLTAIRIAFVRLAYVFFPLSIIFIKYYPEIGRTVARTGDSMFCGVTWHKTHLGELVFLYGLIIIVDLMEMHKDSNVQNLKLARWIRYGLLIMGIYLVHTCGSATATLCFALGCFILWGSGRLVRLQNPMQMLVRCSVVFLLLFTLEKAFDVSGIVLEALGKNKSLTGRTEIWEMAKHANTPVLTGTGFYTFWSTRLAENIQTHFAGVMNTAHNGFLEMYLDGGLIGLGLLLVLMVGWGWRSLKRLLGGTLFGRLAFMIWVLSIVFNHSETAFFRLLPMWFMLLIMMMYCPPLRRPAQISIPTPENTFREREAAYPLNFKLNGEKIFS